MSLKPPAADSADASGTSSARDSGTLKPNGVSGTSPDGRSTARNSSRTGHSSWTSYDKPTDIECALGENEAIKASDSTITPSSKEAESSDAPVKGDAVRRIGWSGSDE